MNQIGIRAKYGLKRHHRQHGDSIHSNYLKDRTGDATSAAIARAEERENIRQQHGLVRVIMVGGKPGPDGAR